ncbi:unnamed protein product [Trichogramma brassicae]|uniref:Uncharacterized protein n=1 Tax=Trichogramma brassicae TaxID=86971 RepID=A0A6H5J0L4_9HYME|nr:unnamed protein product [Trichogramma brassicae]
MEKRASEITEKSNNNNNFNARQYSKRYTQNNNNELVFVHEVRTHTNEANDEDRTGRITRADRLCDCYPSRRCCCLLRLGCQKQNETNPFSISPIERCDGLDEPRGSLCSGGPAYHATGSATTGPKIAATAPAAVAISGASIAAVSASACSRSGAKATPTTLDSSCCGSKPKSTFAAALQAAVASGSRVRAAQFQLCAKVSRRGKREKKIQTDAHTSFQRPTAMPQLSYTLAAPLDYVYLPVPCAIRERCRIPSASGSPPESLLFAANALRYNKRISRSFERVCVRARDRIRAERAEPNRLPRSSSRSCRCQAVVHVARGRARLARVRRRSIGCDTHAMRAFMLLLPLLPLLLAEPAPLLLLLPLPATSSIRRCSLPRL